MKIHLMVFEFMAYRQTWWGEFVLLYVVLVMYTVIKNLIN